MVVCNMSHKPQTLTASEDRPTLTASDIDHDVKNASDAPAPRVQRAAASDPLALIKAMSEEEKIALFS